MTVIAAFRNPSEAVIASDDLMTDKHGNPHPGEPMAKLRLEGNTAYAVAGVGTLLADEPGHVYYLWDFVRDAIQDGGPLRAVGERLVASARTRAEATLQGLTKEGRGVTIDVVLARYEEGRAVLGHVRFWLTTVTGDSWHLRTAVCPDQQFPDGPQEIFLAREPDVDTFRERYPRYREYPPVEAARTFVQMMIDMGVPRVGPPVRCVHITPSGAGWVGDPPK